MQGNWVETSMSIYGAGGNSPWIQMARWVWECRLLRACQLHRRWGWPGWWQSHWWVSSPGWSKDKHFTLTCRTCWIKLAPCGWLTVVGKNGLVLNFFRHMEQVYVPKNRMKDMRVMSGTKSQAFPTSSPLYFKHSFFVRDDHVAFISCTEEKSGTVIIKKQ